MHVFRVYVSFLTAGPREKALSDPMDRCKTLEGTLSEWSRLGCGTTSSAHQKPQAMRPS